MVTTPILNVDEVLNALERWINQRPGLDWRNYGADENGRAAYRAEIRAIGKDKARAVAALDEARAIVSAEEPDVRPALLADAFRAFSGRLTWNIYTVNGASESCPGPDCDAKPGNRHSGICKGGNHLIKSGLSYTTGQYWPTEYRKAAASVLEAYISGWRQHEAARKPQTFTYTTLADVRAANQSIGNHWFDQSTMRFFRTKLESGLIAGKWFITSEKASDDERRRFTVREAQPDGSIDTVGEFQGFSTRADARESLKGGAA